MPRQSDGTSGGGNNGQDVSEDEGSKGTPVDSISAPFESVRMFRQTSGGSKGTEIESTFVPFEWIRAVRRTDHPVHRDANTQGWDEKAWHIRLSNGESLLAALDVSGLCGQAENGKGKVLALEGVEAIEFR